MMGGLQIRHFLANFFFLFCCLSRRWRGVCQTSGPDHGSPPSLQPVVSALCQCEWCGQPRHCALFSALPSQTFTFRKGECRR